MCIVFGMFFFSTIVFSLGEEEGRGGREGGREGIYHRKARRMTMDEINDAARETEKEGTGNKTEKQF